MSYDVVVVGSGASGTSCAHCSPWCGVKDELVVNDKDCVPSRFVCGEPSVEGRQNRIGCRGCGLRGWTYSSGASCRQKTKASIV